jgi:hypothetical protein
MISKIFSICDPTEIYKAYKYNSAIEFSIIVSHFDSIIYSAHPYSHFPKLVISGIINDALSSSLKQNGWKKNSALIPFISCRKWDKLTTQHQSDSRP